MRLWYNETMRLWYHETMRLWYNETMASLRYHAQSPPQHSHAATGAQAGVRAHAHVIFHLSRVKKVTLYSGDSLTSFSIIGSDIITTVAAWSSHPDSHPPARIWLLPLESRAWAPSPFRPPSPSLLRRCSQEKNKGEEVSRTLPKVPDCIHGKSAGAAASKAR